MVVEVGDIRDIIIFILTSITLDQVHMRGKSRLFRHAGKDKNLGTLLGRSFSSLILLLLLHTYIYIYIYTTTYSLYSSYLIDYRDPICSTTTFVFALVKLSMKSLSRDPTNIVFHTTCRSLHPSISSHGAWAWAWGWQVTNCKSARER
jgi:hypothetical protein